MFIPKRFCIVYNVTNKRIECWLVHPQRNVNDMNDVNVNDLCFFYKNGGEISVKQIRIFLCKYISDGAIYMKFPPGVGGVLL